MVVSGLSGPPQSILVRGRNGPGPCACAPARIGRTVLGTINIATGKAEAAFEASITADGQIQQTSTQNLASAEYWAVVFG